jgi:hypothetical protein
MLPCGYIHPAREAHAGCSLWHRDGIPSSIRAPSEWPKRIWGKVALASGVVKAWGGLGAPFIGRKKVKFAKSYLGESTVGDCRCGVSRGPIRLGMARLELLVTVFSQLIVYFALYLHTRVDQTFI